MGETTDDVVPSKERFKRASMLWKRAWVWEFKIQTFGFLIIFLKKVLKTFFIEKKWFWPFNQIFTLVQDDQCQ
jgi:hypothetical protein